MGHTVAVCDVRQDVYVSQFSDGRHRSGWHDIEECCLVVVFAVSRSPRQTAVARGATVSAVTTLLAQAPATESGSRVNDLRAFGATMALGAAVLPRLPSVGPLCGLRRLTGVPCPFCGMTTAMFAFSRFHPAEAFMANPGAFVIAAAVMFAFLPKAVRRRLVPNIRPPRHLNRVAWFSLPLLWIWQLHRFDLI